MRAAMWFLFAAGCAFAPGNAHLGGGDGGGVVDAPVCAFSSQAATCTFTSTMDLMLSGSSTYNTDTGQLVMGATPIVVTHQQLAHVDAIIVRNFHMLPGASLRATGKLPFGIIAFGSVTLDGNTLIDVSDGGAGARSSCVDGPTVGQNNPGGAGGGGGGGFGGAGGNGGNGNSDGTQSIGGAGASSVPLPQDPLGGCPGAKGGKGNDDGGDGAMGGGAIYIAAASRIDLGVGAGLNAGGGGGKGGMRSFLSNGDAGGGGGGSGGMILLEARAINSLGALAANGGGGGGGSGGGHSGGTGGVGILGAQPASGGVTNGGSGTVGGVGGALAKHAGSSPLTVNQGGGGGGGGGVGFVIAKAPDLALALVSP